MGVWVDNFLPALWGLCDTILVRDWGSQLAQSFGSVSWMVGQSRYERDIEIGSRVRDFCGSKSAHVVG